MKATKALLIVATLVAVISNQVEATYKYVCYFGSWSVYRPGAGKFDVENIDPYLCTHLIYGFAALDNKTYQIVSYDPWNDLYDNWGKGAYLRFTGLKKKNPGLKTLLAIGGWNEGSEKYSVMAKDPSKRSTFVQSVVPFLKTYGFDGLDFDWEYPGTRGGDPTSDKANFIALLRELKTAFKPYGYMLTSAVSPGQINIDIAYDIPALASYLDQIHLMTYDYHGAWETETGLNAPLYGNSQYDVANESTLNLDWTVNYWISKGAQPSQIILGMPLYGRGFLLDDPTKNGLKAPASNPIPGALYTQLEGAWGFNEICELVTSAWTKVRDPCFQVPYAFSGNKWIGYDDVESLSLKAQYATAMGVGGALFWSIDQDDFLGKCTSQRFGLSNTVKSVMNSGKFNLPPKCGSNSAPTTVPTTTTTTKPTTTATTVITTTTVPSTTTRAPTTASTTPLPTTTSTARPSTTTVQTTIIASNEAVSPSAYCKKEGFNAYPPNCFQYLQCTTNGNRVGNFFGFLMTCPPGTYFSENPVNGAFCITAMKGFSCP